MATKENSKHVGKWNAIEKEAPHANEYNDIQ